MYNCIVEDFFIDLKIYDLILYLIFLNYMWNILIYLYLDVLDFVFSRSGKSMRRARILLYICRMLGLLIIWFR